MRTARCLFGLVLFITASAVSSGAFATGSEGLLAPYFFVQNGDAEGRGFPLKATDVEVRIDGVIAEVRVSQRYRNTGTAPLHARYVFPGSTRAAVHALTMKIGDEQIRAEVQERQQARKRYEKARKEGKSASLLEQQRPNVFTMDVANILPGDDIDVELRYTELLVPTEGIYRFVFPTVVGPRYASAGHDAASDPWVRNPYLEEGSVSPTTFSMQVRLSAGMPIQEIVCTSHDTDIAWRGTDEAEVRLAANESGAGDRDFILDYRLTGGMVQSGLLLHEDEKTGEDYFLLMVQPPERVSSVDIPAREYVFVVDVSGSMNGFPLDTAKVLLKELIGGLRPVDRFNVVLFAGGSQLMSPVSVPAAEGNLAEAFRLIDRQRGGGGTELLSALQRAAALPRPEDPAARTLVVVTDGYVAADRQVFQWVGRHLGAANVFAFGIGSSVNRYLIEGMAAAGQGEPFVVTRPEQAGVTAGRFRNYIQSPVLTDVSVRFEGLETYDVEPSAIPDLFARRPLVLFGKWRGKPEGAVTVEGVGGTGPYRRRFDVADLAEARDHGALRYLWARHRIARLSDYRKKPTDDANREEITALGLRYNLLTAYTSFVAVHEVVRNPGGKGDDVDQPLPLPKGVSNLAVGTPVAAVPEPELWLMAVVLAAVLGGRRYRGTV
jgi:Ca-activated chloride channel family protein